MKKSSMLIALPFCVPAIGSAQVDVDLPGSFPPEYVFAQAANTTIGAFGDLLRVYVHWSAGAKSLSVVRLDRPNDSSEFARLETEYSVSYHVADVAVRNAGMEIYVSGVTDAGEAIVERWRWGELPGRIGASATPVLTIGDPQGPFSASVVPFGDWTPPVRLPAPAKTVLYQGALGPFMQIAVDPEGRYILLHAIVSGELYRMDGVDVATEELLPTVLYSAAEIPFLAEIGAMGVYDYESEGRLVVFSTNIVHDIDDHLRVHFRDLDNDGVIDDWIAYDYAQFLATPYSSDKSKWSYVWEVD